MSDRHPHSFPPLGDPTRYDAIVSHGRSLRRRRQIGLGAGASGAVAATAMAVLLFTGSPAGRGESIYADDNGVETTTSSTVSSTAPIAPTTEMTIRVDPGAGSARIIVTDPAQPVPTAVDEPARVCVLATISDTSGLALAEGFSCNDGSSTDSAAALDIRVIGAQVGCAAQAVRVDPIDRTTQPVTATFDAAVPAELPAGEYELTVEAVSGIGDGCATSTPDSFEDENDATAAVTVTLP